ncbi:PH domain-containing protein [Rutstroemia sp. NJR-2017a WRK4]|nr:PH domain-containing protein [Rutstroemia sp. NJR-2017a WRK4]
MGRNRVMSFMSQFRDRESSGSPTPPSATRSTRSRTESYKHDHPSIPKAPFAAANFSGSSIQQYPPSEPRESPQHRTRERAPSRPMSMVQTYQPPLMDVNQDTLPELQPIFSFLNSHGNKLYQEGYFLKLDDQNIHGRANADRTWTECFAQLVGTVLSLWDAAELDAAGQDGEVLPKFINLTDASIKMIESLPTRSPNEAPLQNVLSVSTAGKNRYLLHFNSHHSLVQWTAGIRLAMYEHATLQEAYTGALIAGKGKSLNNINLIMERSKLKTEDWARVRFGAGTPWRRCWCVITPPDEKEVQRVQKQMQKKRSAYDRSQPPILKGDIKFYDTKKTKKVRPIATITEAYSAFAIYPQSKPLIDASTLVKVEGSITIHSNPPLTSEGFVFVMPEVHPAVSGFEMMLRWLFPVFDTFGLYGRPGRLIAETSDTRSLMFAMPEHRRHGYLEILDVSSLISEQGSANWPESEWRRRMKEMTAKRMTTLRNSSARNSRYSSRRSRNSTGNRRSRLQFDDSASIKSSPSVSFGQRTSTDGVLGGIPRTDSAPPGTVGLPLSKSALAHQRSISENQHPLSRREIQNGPLFDGPYQQGPTPPPHALGPMSSEGSGSNYVQDANATPERISSEDERLASAIPIRELQDLQTVTSPEPVAPPPAFAHAPGSLPISKPYQSPELRKANNRMSNATLSQLTGAGGVVAAYQNSRDRQGMNAQRPDGVLEDQEMRGVLSNATENETPANHNTNEGMVTRNPNERQLTHNYPNQSPNQIQQPRSQFSNNFNLQSQSAAANNIPPTVSSKDYPSQQQSDNYSNTDSLFDPIKRDISDQSILSRDSNQSVGAQQPRLQTTQSILRKPLPSKQNQPSPTQTMSSTSSLGQHIIDQGAFNLIHPSSDDHVASSHPFSQLRRRGSNVSSVYDDAASTDTPDYASTKQSVRSVHTQKSVEKQRTGTKKIIGNPEVGQPLYGDENTLSSAINIDFGPTFNLASDRTPGKTPSPTNRQSYVGEYGQKNSSPARGASPGPNQVFYPGPQQSGHAKSPGRTPLQSERVLPWQPGMSATAATNTAGRQHGLTPEEFVKQRAVAAVNTPQYAHQRQPSGNVLRGNTPTPPPLSKRPTDLFNQHSRNSSTDLLNAAEMYGPNRHSRNNSTDLLASNEAYGQNRHSRHSSADLLNSSEAYGQNRHSRHSSTDLLNSNEFYGQNRHSRHSSADLLRPSSRGPAAALGPSGNGALTTTLSAREQEHVAKMTGGPLINMAKNSNRSNVVSSGLVGAIDNREKERQQIKQGMSGQAVQHAIALRQQQASQQQQQAEQNAVNYRHSQYGNMTQYAPSQLPAQNQRHSWIAPTANAFPQSGGRSTPGHSPGQYLPAQSQYSPGYQGIQSQYSPGYQASQPQYPPQQQYFPQYPPQQGGQGRSNPGYQGQY